MIRRLAGSIAALALVLGCAHAGPEPQRAADAAAETDPNEVRTRSFRAVFPNPPRVDRSGGSVQYTAVGDRDALFIVRTFSLPAEGAGRPADHEILERFQLTLLELTAPVGFQLESARELSDPPGIAGRETVMRLVDGDFDSVMYQRVFVLDDEAIEVVATAGSDDEVAPFLDSIRVLGRSVG